MSAIWGTISFERPLPAKAEQLMGKPYQKYQIDQFRTYCSPHVFMGCGIQFITAQARREPLPLYDEERGLLFSADCYLDNRTELLPQLAPEDPDISDGVLIYRAFLKWGTDCLKHLLGAFSLALYDFNTERLYLAADHTASRSLYYYPHGDGITFSTLLDPIRNLHPQIETDPLFIRDFLCAPKMIPVLTPEDTLCKGVRKVPPATWLEIRRSGMQAHSYFDPTGDTLGWQPPHGGARAWGTAFLRLYDACVSQTLNTDQNVAAALSSGLDSSSVSVLAAEALKRQNRQLYAYTYVPYQKTDESSPRRIQDETQGVRRIVEMHPNILPHFLNNQGKNAFSSIEEELSVTEIPFKAFVNLPSLTEIGKEARKAGCRVLLTGQYGNSTVSYGELPYILYDAYCRHDFLSYLSLATRYCRHTGSGIRRFLKVSLADLRHYQKNPGYRFKLDNPFLSKTILNGYPLEERLHLGLRDLMERPFFSDREYRQICFPPAVLAYLGEIETRIGLLCGVLFRDPTRDPRILQFCCRVPYGYFCHHGVPRWLIRGNFHGLLPEDMLQHWRVHGVQNADWDLRIQRDWTEIESIFHEVLEHSPIKDLFSWKDIELFFHNAHTDPESMDPVELKYLIFLYTASMAAR